VRAQVGQATIVIAAAAVADYTPATVNREKAAKTQGDHSLDLVNTEDIVAQAVPRRRGLFVAGFAAETHDVVLRAEKKRQRKNLDLIIANDVARADAGFDVDTNVVTMIDASGSVELPVLTKEEVADRILDRICEQSSR